MTLPALSVRGLCVSGPVGPLAQEIAFDLAPGGCLCVIGESGSGKSLAAQALFGLLPEGLRAGGTLSLRGGSQIPLNDRAALRRLWARELFLLPQEPLDALDPTMTVGGQIAEALPRGDRRTGLTKALASMDLPDEAGRGYPVGLSGGMNQRVLAAIAEAVSAPVIVADEPTKGLDEERVAQVVALLRRLLDAGKSLLVITHEPALAAALGGQIAVMRDGCILEHGETSAVLAGPSHVYTRAYLDALPARWLAAPLKSAVGAATVSGRGLSFAYPGKPPLFQDLDLGAAPGRVLAVMGPSGVGKTTLGDVLLGRRRPRHGLVRWGALDPYGFARADLRRARPRHQKLFQDPGGSFAPHRSLRLSFEDLRAIRPDLDLSRRLPPLLDRLRLAPALLDRYPGEVSGGEAQRLALARILLMDPVFLVADEPTSRLDPIVQAEVIGLLREIVCESDLALLLISHDRALVRAVADQVVDLGAGGPGVRG